MINKGRKFFSILLIIIITITVALLGYLAYNYISNYILINEAGIIADEFENETQNIITVEIGEENTTTNEIINSEVTVNNPQKKVTKKYKGYNVIGTIKIPKTKVNYPIVDSTSSQAMDTAIVMLYGVGLNNPGNTVLAGHNYRNGGFFGNNKKLANGDRIYIVDSQGNKVEYTIYNKYITSDSDFSYATRQTNGKREISLSTCTNDNSKRLVIWAKEN